MRLTAIAAAALVAFPICAWANGRVTYLEGKAFRTPSGTGELPESLKEGDDAFAVWGGISGCQSLLALALTEGVAHELVSARPAARFRLPGKGRLEPGADADLVLVDPAAETVLRAEDLRYRHPHSPYVGRRIRGRVAGTWLRGRPVVAGEPRGRFVRPALL